MSERSIAVAALGKAVATQTISQANVTAISNRVAVLEGYNLHTRLAELEARLAQYEAHTHSYTDKDGATTLTKSTGGVE